MARVRGMHGERLESAIGRVETVVVRVLRGIARTVASLVGGSPSPSALSDDDLQVIRRDWGEAVTVEIVPALADAYVESATVLAKEFADAARPVDVVSLDAPSAADFLDAATNRLVAVADTLWEVARKELADGVRAGEGIEELAARLQEAGGFGEARARTIARTECVAAANAASLAQALRLDDPSMVKEWLDSDDTRVREAHDDADGQTAPVGEPFEVGGEFLMYPGQPIGSPSNVINERCTLGYSWDDDEPLAASTPEAFHLPGKHDQSEHGKGGLNAPDTTGTQTSGGGQAIPVRDRTSIGEIAKKVGSQKLTLAAHDDGNLGIGAENGNHIRLSPANVNELRKKAIHSDGMQVGDEFTITHTERRGDTGYTTLKMLVQKTALFPGEETPDGDDGYLGDTFAVHLSPSDDPDFEELRAAPAVEMTAGQLVELAETLRALEGARRVDTGHGQVDMFSDDQSWVLRPMDGPELRLNRRGTRSLGRAIDAVIDDFDDPDDTRPGGPMGPDETTERTVETNVGPVTVSLKGGFEVGDLTIRPHDHDAEIVVAPDRQAAFMEQWRLLTDVLTASASRWAKERTDSLGVVVAAAKVHPGAMVALRPSAADAKRLAVDGGEPVDQLHTTLAYLGTAADIPPETQEAIVSRLRSLVEDALRPDYDLPMVVDGFAVSMFNPPGMVQEDGKDRDTCVVLGLSGGDLDPVHGMVADTLREVFAEAGLEMLEQHTPWVAHTTLQYTDDPGRVAELVDRAGPVTFDAIRVAFGGENTDIPLRPLTDEPDKDEDGEPSGELAAALDSGGPHNLGDEEVPPEGWDEYFADRVAEFVQTDAKLREYWLRGPGAARIRWGSKGDFTRCVRALGRYVRDPEGLCNEYHKEAVGKYPGEHQAQASHGVPEFPDYLAGLAMPLLRELAHRRYGILPGRIRKSALVALIREHVNASQPTDGMRAS